MFNARAWYGLALILGCLFGTTSFGQHKPALQLNLTEAPSDFQVYQRDSVDRCSVTIKGIYYGNQPLRLTRKSRYKYIDNYYPISSLPIEVKADGTFEATLRIGAELREWTVGLMAGESILTEFHHLVCGDVYAVLGQSNGTSDLGGPDADFPMDGAKYNADFGDRYSRALGEGIWGLEAAKPETEWKNWGPASSVYYDFYHSGGWPLKLQHLLIKSQKIPIGIINASLSGSYISDHFKDAAPLPELKDSKGAVIQNNPANFNAREYFLAKLERSGVKNSLKYLFWYQGESDVHTSSCALHYDDLLQKLLTEWEMDLPSLERVFIFQLNTSCLNEADPKSFKLREAQRQFCLQNEKAVLIPTSGLTVGHMATNEVSLNSYLNSPCHYNRFGMDFLAERIHPILRGLVYNNIGITPQQVEANQIQKAKLDKSQNLLTLEFTYDVEIIDTNDAGKPINLKDYFYDQDYDPISVSSLTVNKNLILLKLAEEKRLEKISIYPPTFYRHNKRTYYGPWLNTLNSSLGLPFFADIPVEQTPVDKPIFKTVATKDDFSNSIPWIFHPSDIIINGSFFNSDNPQLLILKTTGDAQLCEYDSTGWEVSKHSDNLSLGVNLEKAWAGDFNGDGVDELLIFNGSLAIYSIKLSGFHKEWVLDIAGIHLDAKNISVADYTASGVSDILLFDVTTKKSELLTFSKSAMGFRPLESKVISLNASLYSTSVNAHVFSGDFNGDGKDDILVFNNGASIFTLIDDTWEWVWSASSFEHFCNWKYPNEPTGLSIMVGELDNNQLGDELLIIGSPDSECAISAYGFDASTNAWSQTQLLNSKHQSVGNWPLSDKYGRVTNFQLINNGGSIDGLLSLSGLECNGDWSYNAELYNLNIALTKAQGDKPKSRIYSYPNPSTGLIHIESPLSAKAIKQIRIFDNTGGLVREQGEYVNPHHAIFDLSTLPNGLYFLEINTGTGTETQKLIINH